MPPCSCVHSCRISPAWSPRYDAATLTISAASGSSSCTAVHRELGDAVAALDPHLHVGDAVLDRLVRRQGPSERTAVAQVLEGELEHAVEPADHLRALQRDGEVQLALDRAGGAADLTDDPVAGNLHTLEVHGGEAPHQVDGVDRLDVQPGADAGTRHCVSPPSVRAVTSSSSACAAYSTGVLTPSRTRPPPDIAGADRADRDAVRVPAAAGPAMHHAATISPATMPGSTSARSSAEPPRATASATTFVGTSGPGETRRPISSATIARSTTPSPERLPPPSSSGTRNDAQPSSAPGPTRRGRTRRAPRRGRAPW